jgi:hypothetical protein
MHVTQKSRLQYRIQYLIFILLFIAIISSLSWISTKYKIRSDWTAGNRNSLSSDTIALLKTIAGPIVIRSYQTEDPALQQAITEILSRYQYHKHDLQFQLLNPDLAIKHTKEDNIKQYGQTVIEYNNKSEVINSLSEQNISNALLRLARNKRPLLHFLQGHGERDPASTSVTGYNTLANKLHEQGVETRTLNLLKDEFNNPASTVAITPSSSTILTGEINKIKDHLENGGNLLWLQDPFIATELKPIMDFLQLNFIDGVVVDNDKNMRQVLGLSHPAVLPIIEWKLHPITEKIKNFTLFITAVALSVNKNSDWKITPLLITQETSWSETGGFTIDVNFDENNGDTKGPLIIGMAFEREFTDENNIKKQRIVVIGDSDFLSNNNIGQGANLDFALNTINWLAEDDELILIAPKTAPDLQLNLNDTKIAIISFGFLIILPLSLLAAGIGIWLKRRKR